MIISRVVAPEKFAWRGETATGAIVGRDADRKLRYAVRANERIMPEPPVAEVAVERHHAPRSGPS